MNSFFIGNLGLGDNLYLIGAFLFLTKFYDKIYFICKNEWYDDNKLFFQNNNKIIIIPIDYSNKNLLTLRTFKMSPL